MCCYSSPIVNINTLRSVPELPLIVSRSIRIVFILNSLSSFPQIVISDVHLSLGLKIYRIIPHHYYILYISRGQNLSEIMEPCACHLNMIASTHPYIYRSRGLSQDMIAMMDIFSLYKFLRLDIRYCVCVQLCHVSFLLYRASSTR